MPPHPFERFCFLNFIFFDLEVTLSIFNLLRLSYLNCFLDLQVLLSIFKLFLSIFKLLLSIFKLLLSIFKLLLDLQITSQSSNYTLSIFKLHSLDLQIPSSLDIQITSLNLQITSQSSNYFSRSSNYFSRSSNYFSRSYFNLA